MTTNVPEPARDNERAEFADGAVRMTVDGASYALDVLYGASFALMDRCYVLIDRAGEESAAAGPYRITLALKDRGEDGDSANTALAAIADEFAAELENLAFHAQIAAKNHAVVESAMIQALSGASRSPSLDDLEEFDFSDDAFEDPLGIAVAWEEKYEKGAKPGDDSEASS